MLRSEDDASATTVAYLALSSPYGDLGLAWQAAGAQPRVLRIYLPNQWAAQPDELRVGDALDFWKVEDIVRGRRLLLRSQMRLPGAGWLEFIVRADRLDVTAYFNPRGPGGYLYWYLMYPAHLLIFRRLARSIVLRTE